MTNLQRHIFDAIPLLSDAAQERLAKFVLDEMDMARMNPVAPEPKNFEIRLAQACNTTVDFNKIGVIKALRTFDKSLGLMQAKQLAEGPVGTLLYRCTTEASAKLFVREMNALGACVELVEA